MNIAIAIVIIGHLAMGAIVLALIYATSSVFVAALLGMPWVACSVLLVNLIAER